MPRQISVKGIAKACAIGWAVVLAIGFLLA
jgi:hypothetical protein